MVLNFNKGDIFQIIPLRVMKHYDKSALMKISQVFRTFNMLTLKGCSETALFREWSNQVFDIL